jgi:hypothetical protein
MTDLLENGEDGENADRAMAESRSFTAGDGIGSAAGGDRRREGQRGRFRPDCQALLISSRFPDSTHKGLGMVLGRS